MMENLEKVCGQGKRFSFLISTAREVSTTSSKTTPKTILVNLMTDAVLVTNNNPLVIGLDGEKMFLHRFKVLKTDVQIAFEGMEFKLGTNVIIRLGKMKRLLAAELCEFCQIRWLASGSWEESSMSLDLLNKIAPGTQDEDMNRKHVNTNFSRIPHQQPFGSQHEALQLVKLYEDVLLERGITF